jgi:sec-independent protein translocase protein TatA
VGTEGAVGWISRPTAGIIFDGRGWELSMLAEIVGPDMLILLVIAMVFFGGSQIPKLARGLGSAQREFKRGLTGDHDDDETRSDIPDFARNVGNGLRSLRGAHDDLRTQITATFDADTTTTPRVASIEASANGRTGTTENDPTDGASFI